MGPCVFFNFFSFSFLKKTVLAEGDVGGGSLPAWGGAHHCPLLKCPQDITECGGVCEWGVMPPLRPPHLSLTPFGGDVQASLGAPIPAGGGSTR